MARLEETHLKVEFVRARWWQAIDFLRLNFEIVRGRDPYADRLMARPWSPSSVLEYLYMLDTLARSDSYFILVDGERAGVVWVAAQSQYIFIYSIGLLPQFQRGGAGKQAAEFIENYSACKRTRWGVAAMSISNKPVHMLAGAFGGRPLGLSTTTLTVAAANPPPTADTLEIIPLNRPEASEAWKRWRLYEVEQVAGSNATELAALLLEDMQKLPRGKYLALRQGGQESGFAAAQGGDVSLFTAKECWPAAPTASLVAELARHLGTTIRRLTLTLTHANALTTSECLDFERRRKDERHIVFFERVRHPDRE